MTTERVGAGTLMSRVRRVSLIWSSLLSIGWATAVVAGPMGGRSAADATTTKEPVNDRTVLAQSAVEPSELYSAALQCDPDIATFLKQHDMNVNAKSTYGFTPLHEAAEAGCPNLVKILIRRGANVNAIADDVSPMVSAYSPLQLVFVNCGIHVKVSVGVIVSKLLIDAKANVNHRDTAGETALHIAVERGCFEMVPVLLANGADPNIRDGFGRTPLDDAIRNGQESMQQLLVQHGAIGLKTSSLIEASKSGDLAKVEMLLTEKTDVNAKNGNGETALVVASWEGHTDVVQVLLKAGADVNLHTDLSGQTALIAASGYGFVTIVQKLLAANADVSARNKRGETALMAAVARSAAPTSKDDRTIVVKVLLAAKADVSPRDADGYTPLIAASEDGNVESMRALLAANADVNAKTNHGTTALIAASERGLWDDPAVIRTLLNAKADVNAKDHDGVTALIGASAKGKLAEVQILLAAHADVTTRNYLGETALDVARRGMSPTGVPGEEKRADEVIRALLAAGAKP